MSMANIGQNPIVDLPQTGLHTDEYWASALGMEPKSFRERCKEVGCPMYSFGNRSLIDAEQWLKAVRDYGPEDEAPKKRKR